ncbi:Endoribonuclease YbeY [Burkholderiales bacterium]|nr:MAG: rRNA maturation RNase YbeY [Burkholderiales bacterium]CAG0966402.1 Endoribonuclease YbeY [Burkholderiales bacterium]
MSGTPNRAKPELSLAVQYADGEAVLPARWRLRRWVQAALARRATLTLRFVDAVEGRRLNRDFRGKDYATNVLTFAYGEGRERRLEGDIVVCVPVLREEAKRQRLALEAHCAHLVMHGILHLQGWDHENEEEAQAMEAREVALLARFGFGDPYGRQRGRG